MSIQLFWIFFVSTFILHSSESKPIDLVAVVNDTNNLRREAAEEFKIPYMHELIYDATLYQQFDLIDNDDIPWFTPISRDFFSAQFDVFKNKRGEMKIYSYRENPLSEVKNPYTAQYLSPLQKRIRCLTRENGTLKCVLGPIRETMWWYYSEGSPGSRCDDDYYNNEGLCTRFQTTTTRKTTATTSLNTVTTEKPYPTIDAEEEEECECSVSTCVKITFIFITLFVHYLV